MYLSEIRNVCRVAVTVAAAMGSLVPRIEAASLTIDAPVQVSPGWTRIAGRYESVGRAPVFRAIARCGNGDAEVHVLDGVVYVAPAKGALWVDLPGTPDRLVPATVPCDVATLSIEMLVNATIVARTPVLIASRAAPVRSDRMLRFKSHKYGAPLGKRTETGLEWLLGSHVSVQFNFERTAQPVMMLYEHDNGVLARLRVGF